MPSAERAANDLRSIWHSATLRAGAASPLTHLSLTLSANIAH